MNLGFSTAKSHSVCSLESLVPYLDGLRDFRGFLDLYHSGQDSSQTLNLVGNLNP